MTRNKSIKVKAWNLRKRGER